MIERFCDKLTKKIRNKMPEVDDERAEIINYGLQLVIGEIPKTFVILLISYIFGVLKFSILAFIFVTPYKMFSGGVHLKTHIGCIVATSLFYVGNAYLSKTIVIEQIYIKYILVLTIWIFSLIMIKLYAPADTEAAPILRRKDRKIKKVLSYITMTLTLVISIFIKNSTISNLLIFGTLIQTLTITRIIYKLTNSKYGYEEYIKSNENTNLA